MPSWHDQVRLIDATPRAARHLAGDGPPLGAGRGWPPTGTARRIRGGTGSLKLYLLTTPDGMPVAWCLATPNIGECEVAAELLAHAARTGALRPGLLALAAVVRHNRAAAERIKRSLTTYDH